MKKKDNTLQPIQIKEVSVSIEEFREIFFFSFLVSRRDQPQENVQIIGFPNWDKLPVVSICRCLRKNHVFWMWVFFCNYQQLNYITTNKQ